MKPKYMTLGAVLTGLVLLSGSLWAQQITLPTVYPAAIALGTASTVTVAVLVISTGPAVISNGVNLLSVDQNGSTLAILGTLNDSGLNGDSIAGDGIFSGTVSLNPSTASQVYLQVSAAFKGQLKRTLSPIVAIPAVPATMPTAPRPFNVNNVVTDPQSNAQIVCNELLVSFTPGTSLSAITAALSQVGGSVVGWLPEIDLYQVGFSSCDAGVLNAALATLQGQPTVTSAQMNVIFQLFAPQPVNDPLFPSQWSLQTILAPNAWNLIASGKAIAIIDTGIDYTHEDLAGQVLSGLDQCAFLDSNGNCIVGGNPIDTYYHGTGTASVAAAITNNNLGMAGVAYRAPLIAEKVFYASNSLGGLGPPSVIGGGSVYMIAEAILHAVRVGARVINLSLGGNTAPRLEQAVQYALNHYVVVVAGAGNSGNATVTYPAGYSYLGVIAVAASDENNERAIWTDCPDADAADPASTFGAWVDVYAPGKNLLFAARSGFCSLNLTAVPCIMSCSVGNCGYAKKCMAGTSWATPIVSGTASLMLSLNPHLKPSQVKAIIKSTALRSGHIDSTTAPGGNNPIYVVNTFAAVQQALSQVGVLDVPPTAGFSMSSGAQVTTTGGTLSLTVGPGGSATVFFDGSTPKYSTDIDGTVVSWLWYVNSSQVSTSPSFSRSFSKGTYQVGLFVGDDSGTFGPAAAGTINVTESIQSIPGLMNSVRSGHTATLLIDGTVLVTGGDTPSGQTATAEIYTPSTGMWRYTKVPMNVARSYHTATLLNDGQVLIAAGGNSSGSLYSAELFDPTAETFTSTGSLTYARHIHRAVLLPDGRVMAIAGSSTVFGIAINTNEIYNPSTGLWAPAAPLPGPGVTWHTAMLLSDGRVFVCGGYNGLVESSVSSAVYVYTPATDTWQTLNSMLVRRCIHTASLLNDDRVLITGGQNLNSTQESSTEIYTTTANSGTGQSVFGNFLSVSRQTHTATLLQTADVLVIGGENGSIGSIAQNEQYSHTTGAWSEPSSLATSRESHTATLLPSGQVLVTGGTSYTPSGPRTILDSAELF